MIRRLLVVSLAGCSLAACSTMPTEAPIDESKAVATASPAATGQDARRASDAGARPISGGSTPTAVEQPVVETRPLPTPIIEPTGTVSAISAASARPELTIPGAHKDPTSPLAQRVIYFEFDSAVIDARFQPLLEAHATYLKANPGFKVILQGHTDERGSREYNLALGQRRAESVRQALRLLGVAEAQMEAVSLGEEKPAVEGHDESAWKMNRRTEIHYVGE